MGGDVIVPMIEPIPAAIPTGHSTIMPPSAHQPQVSPSVVPSSSPDRAEVTSITAVAMR